MLDYEQKARRKGYSIVVGLDEAGRGPLAGPVVAAAVFLKQHRFESPIRDSKKLSPRQREKAFLEIYQKAHVGIGIMSEAVVDEVNILEATFLAMTRAVEQLISHLPQYNEREDDLPGRVFLLIDGHIFRSSLLYPFQTIIKGDNLSLSIACASIIAKVTRDRILDAYDQVLPQYGFRQHKGYATISHREALRQFGPSFIHRRSFHYL